MLGITSEIHAEHMSYLVLYSPSNLVTQWQEEWSDRGLPQDQAPVEITARSNMESALKAGQMTWIVSHHRLAIWSSTRTVPSLSNRNRTITETLDFDQELQEVMHAQEKVFEYEHYVRELRDQSKDKNLLKIRGTHCLNELSRYQSFVKVTKPAYRIHRLIVDEVHLMKNLTGALAPKVVVRLSRMSSICWGLTATLITNGMQDLRVPMILMGLVEPSDDIGFNKLIVSPDPYMHVLLGIAAHTP